MPKFLFNMEKFQWGNNLVRLEQTSQYFNQLFLYRNVKLAVLIFVIFGFASECLSQEKNDENKDKKFKFSYDFSLGLSEGLTEEENTTSLSTFTQDSYFNLLGQSDWSRHALAFSVDVSKGGEELTGDEDIITEDRTVNADFYARLDLSDSLSVIGAASQSERVTDEDHPDSIYLSGLGSIGQTKRLAFGTVWKGENTTLTSKLHHEKITDATQSEDTVLSKSDRDQSFLRLELARKINDTEIALLSGVADINYGSSLIDRDLTGRLLGMKMATKIQRYKFSGYIYQNNRIFSNSTFDNKKINAGYLNLDWYINDGVTFSTKLKKSFLERNLEPQNSTGIIGKNAEVSLNYKITPEIATRIRGNRYISSLDGIDGESDRRTKSASVSYKITSNVSTSGSISELKSIYNGVSSERLTKNIGANMSFDVTPAIALNASVGYRLESGSYSRKTNSNNLSADYSITPKLSVSGMLELRNEHYDSENSTNVTREIALNYQFLENISLIGTLSDIDENASDSDNLDDVLAIVRIEGEF